MHGAYRRNFGPESLVELSKNMIIQHEDYLKQDDPDRKADALRYMAGYATQYLHLVPQEKKFKFKQTERVLHNSAMNIGEFDPREGYLAFRNLAKYAENLLEQPWRKDFHVIKLTSGYYVHNVAAQLQNAHELLIVMGYVNIDDTTLKLLPNPDYSLLKALSRDCYVASQECMILSQIWQHVADQEPDYPLTIGEVFEYRKNHLGDTDTICNKLLYDIRQRMHLVKQQQQQQQQQLKFHQQQQQLMQKPHLLKTHRFVPVDRLVDYGVDDVSVDEPDLLPSRGSAPDRDVDRVQDLLKNLNVGQYQDDEHIYDPVYGSNEVPVVTGMHLQPQKVRRSVPASNQLGPGQYYTRKSTGSANYPGQMQQQQHNFVTNGGGGGNNISMMYGDQQNQREQSLSPMIPKTVTSLFSSNTSPANNVMSNGRSNSNVSKSSSMNSISAASSSSATQNFGMALTRCKVKETDLDADLMTPSQDDLYRMNNVVPAPVVPMHNRGRKSMPNAFTNYQSQPPQHPQQPQPPPYNQVYPDEFYPSGIVKPVAVYGSTINSGVSHQSNHGGSQSYMRARQNSDNSEDVLNEAYAYASEVNQMPKGQRINPSNPPNTVKGTYQHQATPIPLAGSDSDSHSHSAEINNMGRSGGAHFGKTRSGSSTDASSSWEGSVLEGDYKMRPKQQLQQPIPTNKFGSRERDNGARRPNHIDIGGGGGAHDPTQMRCADSSPESDQKHEQKNGYRELNSSSSGDSPTSSSSRNYPRNEELNSLDSVYYDYLLKQGHTDEVLGRENINSSQNSREVTKEKKRTSRSSIGTGPSHHHHPNYATNEPEENHIYDGRRVIPKKKQQNRPVEGPPQKQRNLLEPHPQPSSSSGRNDPNYNLISSELSKPSHEKNLRKGNNSERSSKSPVESELPPHTSPIPSPPKPVEPWDCRFCTFRNTMEERICEMCAKSKDFFEEEELPLPPPKPEERVNNGPKLYSVVTSSGIQPPPQATINNISPGTHEESQEEIECPQCTLLNPIRARVCDACNFRLKPVESPKTMEEATFDIR